MFKRFSHDARTIVVTATHAAAGLGSEQTEAEHFLLALLTGPSSKAQEYLRRGGLTRNDVERALLDTEQTEITFDVDDAAALRSFGIDLPQVLHELEERFGPLPPPARRTRGPRKLSAGIGDSAKQVLHHALVEASHDNVAIAPEHLLLGLLCEPSGLCRDLVTAYSFSYEGARDYLFPPPRSNAS